MKLRLCKPQVVGLWVLALGMVGCSSGPSRNLEGGSLSSLSGAIHYVSPGGLDSNPGTLSSPFQTIQKCATVSSAGDSCLIRAGVYRETVAPNSGVSFAPYNSESVTVDGSDPVTGWTPYSGSIYKASITLNPGLLANQVFVGGTMAEEARWPNTGADLLSPTWATMGTGTTTTTVLDSSIPSISGGWAGATIHLWAGSNPFAHQTGTVTSSGGGSVSFSAINGTLCPYLCAQSGGKYYLVGKLAALDSANEWFYDAASHQLYLWAPGGGSPSNVSAKQRDLAFDLRGKSNVGIQGLKLFSSMVFMDNASIGNIIDGLDARYLSHYTTLPKPTNLAYSDGDFDVVASHGNDSGIVVLGSNNTVKNSTLVYSAGNGIRLGGTNNTATNNLIHDVGYMGSYATGVNISGSGQKVDHNTIYSTGRDAITVDWHVNGLEFKNNDISYNNAYASSKIAPDSGVIYVCCQLDGSGTHIHHNWVHDATQTSVDSPTAGIYIDNSSGGFEIDQNVSWNNKTAGIYLHGNGSSSRNNLVHNNDLLSGQSKSVWLLNLNDASGTIIQNNKIPSAVVVEGGASGLTLGSNSEDAIGANEGYYATVGCAFTGCTSGGLPSRPGNAGVRSATSVIEAESYNAQSGVSNYGTSIGSLDSGDWVRYSSVDFGAGVSQFIANIGVDNPYAGKTLQIRLDSTTGTLLGTLTVAGTGGWSSFTDQTTSVSGAAGVHDLYLVAQGGAGVGDLNSFRFTSSSLAPVSVVDDAVQGTGNQQMSFTGSGWNHCSGGCGNTTYYNNTVSYTDAANSAVQVAFTGARFVFYGSNWGTVGGIGAVSIDGGAEAIVDFSTSSVIWTSPVLSAGNHSFKLRATGSRCAACSASYVNIDKVEITP